LCGQPRRLPAVLKRGGRLRFSSAPGGARAKYKGGIRYRLRRAGAARPPEVVRAQWSGDNPTPNACCCGSRPGQGAAKDRDAYAVAAAALRLLRDWWGEGRRRGRIGCRGAGCFRGPPTTIEPALRPVSSTAPSMPPPRPPASRSECRRIRCGHSFEPGHRHPASSKCLLESRDILPTNKPESRGRIYYPFSSPVRRDPCSHCQAICLPWVLNWSLFSAARRVGSPAYRPWMTPTNRWGGITRFVPSRVCRLIFWRSLRAEIDCPSRLFPLRLGGWRNATNEAQEASIQPEPVRARDEPSQSYRASHRKQQLGQRWSKALLLEIAAALASGEVGDGRRSRLTTWAAAPFVYIRQSTADSAPAQPGEPPPSVTGLADRARQLGWTMVEVIDDDLGRSGRRHPTGGRVSSACWLRFC